MFDSYPSIALYPSLLRPAAGPRTRCLGLPGHVRLQCGAVQGRRQHPALQVRGCSESAEREEWPGRSFRHCTFRSLSFACLSQPDREGNFTAFIGGCWVMLGLQFVRDVSEFRPAWRCAGATPCVARRLLLLYVPRSQRPGPPAPARQAPATRRPPLAGPGAPPVLGGRVCAPPRLRRQSQTQMHRAPPATLRYPSLWATSSQRRRGTAC